ncbi:MAG: hypothetical protein OEY51_10620, partial [Cyclobacteriaceae bacterium]|nr:hypothetical protein [Cyclobacteriaceae bacterium]
TISRRLVERLLFDLREGVDQLPVLQHLLNRIWHVADQGRQEMDLIHYAKVGGMAEDELPGEYREIFGKWLETLSADKRRLYDDPGLTKALDIHANELYEGAWSYYKEKRGNKDISIRDVKLIIAMTFACLTKIDDSRAVRNIMTLGDISNIINRPDLDVTTIGKVIDIYREQGNTFIRPFIEEGDPSTTVLRPETALDITHESLIRNWERLGKWAGKEYEYYETFIDFRKQLDKWLGNGRSAGYLLPIGSLTYFEKWYADCRPNTYWINRYLSESDGGDGSTDASEKLMIDARTFLDKSAKKVALTRAYMRYGTAKVAGLLAFIIVLGLSAFYYYDGWRKENEQSLSRLEQLGLGLLERPDVDKYSKAGFLINLERVEPGSLLRELSAIQAVEQRLLTANAAYEFFLMKDNRFHHDIKFELISFIEKELQQQNITGTEKRLELMNGLFYNLMYDRYMNPDKVLDISIQKLTTAIVPLLEELIQKGKVNEMILFNQAIENMVNNKVEISEDLGRLTGLLSPFSQQSKGVFENIYPLEAKIINGPGTSLTHNGGYQMMGYLYAAGGDLQHVKQCTDSLLKYNPEYWDKFVHNNAFNILGVLVQYGHWEKAEEYIQYLLEKGKLPPMQFYNQLLDRSGHLKLTYLFNHLDETFIEPNYNPGLSLLSLEGVNWFFDQYKKAADALEDNDFRHYSLAMIYKQRGIYAHKYERDRGKHVEKSQGKEWFIKSLDYYHLVSSSYLQEKVIIGTRYFWNGQRNMERTRAYLYLYPDHLSDEWFTEKYVSFAFMEFMIQNGHLHELYQSASDMEVFNDWLANYHEVYPSTEIFGDMSRNRVPIPDELLVTLHKELSVHPDFRNFDTSFLHLILA